MRVYVAGPMTGYPRFNWDAFYEAERILRGLGHEVRNPARMGHIDGGSWTDYLKRDLLNVCEVDAICTLPGWDTSKGARLEVHVALELGLRVLPLSVWESGIEEKFVAGQHDGTQATGLEDFEPPAESEPHEPGFRGELRLFDNDTPAGPHTIAQFSTLGEMRAIIDQEPHDYYEIQLDTDDEEKA